VVHDGDERLVAAVDALDTAPGLVALARLVPGDEDRAVMAEAAGQHDAGDPGVDPGVGDAFAPAVHVVLVRGDDVAQRRRMPQAAPELGERHDPAALPRLLDDAPEVDERVVMAGVLAAVAAGVAGVRKRLDESAPAQAVSGELSAKR